MNIKKYLVPFLLGFVGMLVAHIIILLAFGLGANFPIYFISYVIVFSMISYFLTRRNPQWWLSNIICLFLIPFFTGIFCYTVMEHLVGHMLLRSQMLQG